MNRYLPAMTGAILLLGSGLPADTGREAVIAVRRVPYIVDPMRSGPYPEGLPEPERPGENGVLIAGQLIRQPLYDEMKRARYVPMRRELSDAECFAALRPEVSEAVSSAEDLLALSRRKFRDWRPFLFWGFRRPGNGRLINGAENAYEQWFDPHEHFRTDKLSPGAPPAVPMMRWGGSYWNTGDERWARAARDAYLPFYHANRPPLHPVLNAKPRTMWHVLSAGSRVPTLIETYAYVSASPEWQADHHLAFWKSMLEHARFLRYTTVPSVPWTPYNPFGYGNWVLYQLQGLLAIAAYFPEFAEADDWLDHARNGIGQHADWCVFPDSGFDEYSVSYAGQVAGQFAYCWNTMMQQNVQPPPRFRDNVIRLHELFLKTSLTRGAQLPFGDTHRGRDSAPSRCSWAALAFLDPRFLRLATPMNAEYITEGARVLHPDNPEQAGTRCRAMAAPPATTDSTILPETGWVIMRGQNDRQTTDVALSYRASQRVFHSGWEMLGLNIWVNGQPMIVKLLGYNTYLTGYPEGFCRTPRQANIVLLEEDTLTRTPGSLRNWFASPKLDYLHADHAGWRDGNIVSRRRILFIKPDWLVIIDDIEGTGHADIRWQMHTEEAQPEIHGHHATLQRGGAVASFTLADGVFAVESHPVQGTDRTVYLLTSRRTGALPLRIVTVVHVDTRDAPRTVRLATQHQDDCEGIAFACEAQPPHRLQFETPTAAGGRFIRYTSPDERSFMAHDGDNHGLGAATAAPADELPPWHSRAGLGDAAAATAAAAAAAIPASSVSAFEYHGRPELTPVGTAARVSWQTDTPAMHWVRYREKGSSQWRRQLQPGHYKQAWILLPDLSPGAEYELRAVSRTAAGTLAATPVIIRRAPLRWDPLGQGNEPEAAD